MQILGFNLTKVLAERNSVFSSAPAVHTDIELTKFEKQENVLLKDIEAIQASFKFSIVYSNSKDEKEAKDPKNKEAEIILEGVILLSATKEESKEILKAWKQKEVVPKIRFALFNLVLRKCTSKALQMEEEINLPTHIPLPQLAPQTQAEGKDEKETKEEKK